MKKYLIGDSSKNTFKKSISIKRALQIWFLQLFATVDSLELWYNTILVLLTGNMKNAQVAIDALSIWYFFFPSSFWVSLSSFAFMCLYWLPHLQPQHPWVGDDDLFWILGCSKVLLVPLRLSSTQKHIFIKFNHVLVENLSVFGFQMSLEGGAHKRQSFQLGWRSLHPSL